MHKEERRDMFNGETYFKAKEGFVSRSVSEQDVLIAIGNNIANFNGFITLNTTASFLWKSLPPFSSLIDLGKCSQKLHVTTTGVN